MSPTTFKISFFIPCFLLWNKNFSCGKTDRLFIFIDIFTFFPNCPSTLVIGSSDANGYNFLVFISSNKFSKIQSFASVINTFSPEIVNEAASRFPDIAALPVIALSFGVVPGFFITNVVNLLSARAEKFHM